MDPAHFPGTRPNTLGVLSRSFHNFLIIFGCKNGENIVDFTVASFHDIVPVAVETLHALRVE